MFFSLKAFARFFIAASRKDAWLLAKRPASALGPEAVACLEAERKCTMASGAPDASSSRRACPN
eukprot:12983641-Alexandrium_andersonii.AAC.1